MMSTNKPNLFSSLIGNEKAKAILTKLLPSLPPVLLFHGPDGIGKGHFALEIAHALFGKTKKDHPDLHLLFPLDEQHPVSTIRELIQEASLPPFEAPVKFFIIHDAEKMLPTSSNALLKTLEEPPPRTHFILLSSQPSLLLPTITSRCFKIPFFPLFDEQLTHFGKKIALLSQGSISKALYLTEHPSHFPIHELFHCKTYSELHHYLDKIDDDLSPEETNHLFEEILYHIREHDPLNLEKAIPLLTQARLALHHHVKLKTVLEHFFLR